MIRVTYADGSTAEVERIVPVAWLDVEEELGVDAASHADEQRVFLRVLWTTLKLRHGEEREFRAWAVDVDEIEASEAEASDADPTPATSPSPGDSPRSSAKRASTTAT